MRSARASRVGERLTTFGHYVMAFVILLKGIDKAEQHWRGHEAMVVFLFASAAYIAAGTAMHHRLHGWRGQLLQASFYGIEAAISFMIASYLRHEGKVYLPYLFAAAGVAFTFAVAAWAMVALRTRAASLPAHPSE
jgi:hypothetical protein